MTDQPSDLQILALANRFYRRSGARDQAAAAELGLTSTGYARRLLAIVEAPSPVAVAAYGPLLRRLSGHLALERAKRAPVRRPA